VAPVTRAVPTYPSDDVRRPSCEIEEAAGDHENIEGGVSELDHELPD
jgi:hypothetical protein